MKKLILTFLLVIVICSHALSQWVQMSNGISAGATIYSLAVNGSNIFAGTHLSGVYLSTNNGTTWSQTALNNKKVFSFAFVGNNIYAGTESYPSLDSGAVYFSSNNGLIWVQSGVNIRTVTSFAILGNNMFAGTNYAYGIYLTTNNGINWSLTSLNNKSVYSLAFNGNNIFAGTYSSSSYSSGVFLSTNNGTNWNQTALNNTTVYSLAVSGNNIYARTDSGVYFSDNNSASWSKIGLNNKAVSSFAINGSNLFAGVGNFPSGSGGVYFSTNNGANWIQKNQGFNDIPSVRSLLITNDYIFAGTFDHSIWRRPISDIVSTENISTEIPMGFSLSQNYPNPFNPVTRIRYELPRAGVVRLAVYDVMGREVEMLVNDRQATGSYEAVWDGTRFASGVCFYRLTTEGFSETKKMLLIR